MSNSATLELVSLRCNQIADAGAAALAGALERSRRLTTLDLSFCQGITDVGAFALARALLRSRRGKDVDVTGREGIIHIDAGDAAMWQAERDVVPVRLTLSLLGRAVGGASLSLVGRFVLHKDGDHAGRVVARGGVRLGGLDDACG